LALLLLAAGCASKPEPPLPLTEALLALAGAESGRADDASYARAELGRIVARVRSVAQHEPALRPPALLQRVVFDELGFVREVDDPSLGFVLLPGVLHARRGSCVGLGTLYLALAERLAWPMHGVMVPGHFFVRMERGGVAHNLELLHRGEELPDEWYRKRFPIPGESAREYARPLDRSEVLGVVEFDVGNERKRAQQLMAAAKAYDSARRHFPDFAEAHASAGAIAQLLGQLDRAAVAYRAALTANPQLPGVAQNLELLARERRESLRH
jgi:regulator of sirC expression with transglutaminase-like and TPR domain